MCKVYTCKQSQIICQLSCYDVQRLYKKYVTHNYTHLLHSEQISKTLQDQNNSPPSHLCTHDSEEERASISTSLYPSPLHSVSISSSELSEDSSS